LDQKILHRAAGTASLRRQRTTDLLAVDCHGDLRITVPGILVYLKINVSAPAPTVTLLDDDVHAERPEQRRRHTYSQQHH
jgi:hypothetical protein